jgi:hypothetical protein
MKPWAALAVVPLAWAVVAGALQSAQRGYSAFDPDYYYLLSALDLLRWQTIGMFHHPGTPAEIFGAVVLRATQPLTAPETIQAAVLANPDGYLPSIHTATAATIAVALLAAGVAILRTTGRLGLAIWIQCAMFLAPVVAIDSIARFKAEPFLLMAGIALAVVMVSHQRGSGSQVWQAGWFGMICGFGLATKLTFVSVLIAPFVLLRGFLAKLTFLTALAAGFALWTLPIWDRYDRLRTWTINVSTHTGIYGDGAEGIVDPDSYRRGLAALLSRNPLFDAVVLAAVVVIVWALVRPGRWRLFQQRDDLRTLCAITLSQVIGFALAAKYGEFADGNRYLFGAYCLMGVSLWLMWSLASQLSAGPRPVGQWLVRGFVVGAVAAAAIGGARAVIDRGRQLAAMSSAYADIDAKVAAAWRPEFDDYAVIHYTGLRSPTWGLFQASIYSTGQLEPLRTAAPGHFFCADCTPENWERVKYHGLNHDRQFDAADVRRARGGGVVLIGGTPATVTVLSRPE